MLHYRDIVVSTYGIIFCGTPHLGGNKAEFGGILVNIASVYYHTNAHLVGFLKSTSERLQADLRSFNNISASFKTFFAYETLPTPLKSGGHLMVRADLWLVASLMHYRSSQVPQLSFRVQEM